MADEDDSQKTEDPTQKRLADNRKKGKVAVSREVNNFLLLLVVTIIFSWMSVDIVSNISSKLYVFIAMPHDIIFNVSVLYIIIKDLLFSMLVLFSFPIIMFISVIFLSSFLQNGVVFSFDPITPKWEKISIFKGFKRIFSSKAVIELIKGIVKITTVGFVGSLAIYSDVGILSSLYDTDIIPAFLQIKEFNLSFLSGVLSVLLVIAGLDLLYQKYNHFQESKMTKQEIKDEFKQSEGSPEIKSKLRRLRQEAAKKRMMQAIPKADVIITNPTHYAVALKYDMDTMPAPKLIAKGQDHIALKMKQVGMKHEIPIVENKSLARALYASVDVDNYIPEEHYTAVADIINYVYSLNRNKSN